MQHGPTIPINWGLVNMNLNKMNESKLCFFEFLSLLKCDVISQKKKNRAETAESDQNVKKTQLFGIETEETEMYRRSNLTGFFSFPRDISNYISQDKKKSFLLSSIE